MACLRNYRQLVGLPGAPLHLEREMARQIRDLMVSTMFHQTNSTTPTPTPNGIGLPTPSTSQAQWSTSAEVHERLQAAQTEERRKVQENKLRRIEEEARKAALAKTQQEEADRTKREKKVKALAFTAAKQVVIVVRGKQIAGTAARLWINNMKPNTAQQWLNRWIRWFQCMKRLREERCLYEFGKGWQPVLRSLRRSIKIQYSISLSLQGCGR